MAFVGFQQSPKINPDLQKMQNVLHSLKITGVYAREKTRSIEGNCINFTSLALYRSIYYGGNKSFEKGE